LSGLEMVVEEMHGKQEQHGQQCQLAVENRVTFSIGPA
jgi:hypothetical protein